MKYFFYFILFISPSVLSAQLFINEVCSDNESIIADEEGDFEDWLELYNSSANAINLDGYWLSDDENEPGKWSFPAVQIPAGGFLLIFASEKNFNGTNPHTNFKISKDGEPILLSNPQMDLIDWVDVPALNDNESFGRQPDGSDDLYFFPNPSPQQSNNASTAFNFAEPPTISNLTFFYDQTTPIEIRSDYSNATIYYTIDGSIPDENSILYTGPFLIDTTTSIRAAVVTPDLLLSKPFTRTFFISEEHELPVMALTTAPENLWDWETGIFVDGPNADSLWPYFGANFWADLEIPMHIEYFKNERLEVEYPLAAKIHGGKGARTKKMKALRLLAKGSFGTALMDYPFFENRTNTKFERLVLRNASGDFNICHMRDEFIARYFLKEKLFADGISEQPVTVYINGTYWGVMHIREKFDRFYLQYNYGIDPDNVDILERDTLVVDGNFDIFDTHEAFILDHDLSQNSNYEIASQYFDTKNLMDYIAAQTFVNNTDWPSNNSKHFRERTDTAKWRYIIYDMDVAMSLAGFTKAHINSFGGKMTEDDVRLVVIFKSFLENETFRHGFINRYLDLLNTSFSTKKFRNEVIQSRDEIEFEMQRHLPRWGKTYDRWYNTEIPRLITFTEERPAYARQYVREYFELPTEEKISIATYPEFAGNIQLNTISILNEELPWEGIYCNQVPIRLTVVPQLGFTFSHWESNFSDLPISSDPSIEVQVQEGERYTAIFEADLPKADLSLFPNPVEDELNLNFTAPKPGDIEIKVFDAIGRQLFNWEEKAGTGENHFNLSVNHLDHGAFIVHIVGSDYCISKKFIRL